MHMDINYPASSGLLFNVLYEHVPLQISLLMLILMPQLNLQDESADLYEEETDGDSSEAPEDPESTRVVVSAADPSLVRTPD